MEWVETTGPSVEEAKNKALEILGLSEREAEIMVLAEEKTGLFGRVRSEARVRARVKPRRARKPRQNNRNRSSSGNKKGSGSRNSNRNQNKSKVEKNKEMKNTLTTQEMEEIIIPFFGGLLSTLGREGEVVISEEGDFMEVRVVGDNLGVLIGPGGSVLSSLFDVMNTVIQSKARGAKYPRIRLDVGDYRRKRREALAEFAEKLANEAKETTKEIVLEPMNAADRKIVHNTVAEISGVHTKSEGEDTQRRVVIYPGSDE